MLKKKIIGIVFLLGVIFIPLAVGAASTNGIQIPQETGLSEDSFAEVLDRILNWMLMIFVIISTIAFVITGLQFIFSFGGASGTQENAKKNLTYTIIAIFIVGGALIILNTVVGLLGDAPAGSTTGGSVQDGGFDFGGVGGPFDTGKQHEPGVVDAPFMLGGDSAETGSHDTQATTTQPRNSAQDARDLNAAEKELNNTYDGNAGYDDSYEQY